MSTTPTEQLIAAWRSVYNQYLHYCYIDDPKAQESMWVSTTNSLMEMWGRMENKDLYHNQFAVYLQGWIGYYVKLNEFYGRFGRQEIIEKNTGGRYLP